MSLLQFCESQIEFGFLVADIVDVGDDVGVGGNKPAEQVELQTVLKETEKLQY